jgi:hypothetical protein
MKLQIRISGVIAGIAAVIILGIATVPVTAHHSFAMYDTAVEKTLTGRLTRFVIGANHSQYFMEVVNPDGSPQLDKATGKPVVWTIETTSAAQLSSPQINITVETFKIGTIFTATFSPLRDGRNGGAQRGTAIIMCGLTMPAGGCTEATGKRYGGAPVPGAPPAARGGGQGQ